MEELTKKQKIFVKEYVKTENGTQSALKAYDTKDPNTANQIAIENLRKPTVINVIKSIAEQIPNEDLVKVHREGLNAGKKTEDGIEPDYATRHKYLDTAYKIKGMYQDPQGQVNILMPVLVKFIDKNEGTETNNNRDTN